MERIVVDKNIRHGKPVIRGTRVPVDILLGSLAGGEGEIAMVAIVTGDRRGVSGPAKLGVDGKGEKKSQDEGQETSHERMGYRIMPKEEGRTTPGSRMVRPGRLAA